MQSEMNEPPCARRPLGAKDERERERERERQRERERPKKS